jgi:uncharacterized coiled-coil protein SlyX
MRARLRKIYREDLRFCLVVSTGFLHNSSMKTINVFPNPIHCATNRLGLVLVPLLLACFALPRTVKAVTPAPDGGYFGANTAEGGAGALFSLTTGTNNTALGSQALFSLTTGIQNTATGAQALKNNTADHNTADGFQALNKNTTGENNTAIGWRALFENTTGDANTANGLQALNSNRIGTGNTAMGFQTLYNNTTGNHNAAVGEDALSGNTTGSFNIALGYGCGGHVITGSFNIDIGNTGVAGDDSTIRIGTNHTATYIAGIFGTNIVGSPVAVDSDGHLGVGAASSARFKDAIKPMDKASEAILALKPVTFYYKKEIDPKRTAQFGLVAEQVEKVNPNLVTRDAKGELYTVRYEAVNAMLLNEFLKAHRKMEEQEATIAQLKSTVARQETAAAQQQKQIEALTAGLQKVSAQVEMSRPATQTVLNNP